jgi:thiol-disulfide isomerase/thioredoxin
MARHLSNCIHALAAMLVAAPAAFGQESFAQESLARASLAQPPLAQELQAYALKHELPKSFIMHEKPEPGAVLRFEDGQARPRSLADFRGKVVLLNIWATWCVPCIKEIPALDHLVTALNGADVAVVAVSVDRKGLGAVRKAFADLDVRELAPYIDPSGQALRTVRSMGLPTSLLIDREGREFGRVVGPAAWDDAATIAFFRQAGSPDSRTERQPDRTGVDPRR